MYTITLYIISFGLGYTMTQTAIETTEIEITDSTIELSDTQVQYVNQGIAKGLADMRAGRGLSNPEEIDQAIQKLIEQKQQAYFTKEK